MLGKLSMIGSYRRDPHIPTALSAHVGALLTPPPTLEAPVNAGTKLLSHLQLLSASAMLSDDAQFHFFPLGPELLEVDPNVCDVLVSSFVSELLERQSAGSRLKLLHANLSNSKKSVGDMRSAAQREWSLLQCARIVASIPEFPRTLAIFQSGEPP